MQSFKLLLPALGAALLASCGDDSDGQTIVRPDQKQRLEVASLADAGLCDWNRYGQIALVTSEDREYVCDGEKWDFVYYEPDWSSEGGESSDSGEGGGESSEGGFGVSSSSSSSADAPIELCGAVSYETATHFCDIRDSSVYEMVRIGSQTWMKENLNFDYKIDGVSYGSHCYNNEPDSCAKYGRLYTWAAAMDTAATGCGDGLTCGTDTGMVRSICPDGWHLPSRAEWDTLVAAVGGKSTAGTALKASEGWSNDRNGTNTSGFSALPAGDGSDNIVAYHGVGSRTSFWSTAEAASNAIDIKLSDTSAAESINYKYYLYSVRCLKN